MSVRARLSLMMFLEYVIWGSWLPLVSLYLSAHLGFSSTRIGWVFATSAVASVVAVFISGQVADRHVSSERFLAVSHLVGGAAMLALPFQKSFVPFFLTMLLHQLAYVPTLSITNSICFHHLRDAQKEFGAVRLWGTFGWIAASWPFIVILRGKGATAMAGIFVGAGLASLALAGLSLLLPATAPSKTAGQRYAPFEAVKLLARPAVAVLFVVTFLDALVHQCYFQWTSPFLAAIGVPENWIMIAMSISQMAEIPTMAALGLVLARLGWRWTMILGILGHVARFLVYSLGEPTWLVVGSNLVHGLCYAFFFATVYIFVDEYFPRDARASAQGLFNFLILGLGPFAGSLLWGWLGGVYETGAGVDFAKLFLVPAGLGVLAAVILLVAFHPSSSDDAPAVAKAA